MGVGTWLRQWLPAAPLGSRGERLAARHFRKLGYRILAQGHRTKVGEIDIVAARKREVVFVEVKTRSSADFGGPELAVNADKRRRVTRAATLFLKSHKLFDVAVRFDIVAITWPADTNAKLELSHFEAAFDAEGPWSI